MSLDYAYEKLSVAVISMATSTDSLQKRLANAYVYGFHTIGLDVKADLTPNLRSLYHEIEKNLTKEPARGDEGSIVATTNVMRDEEAKKLIEQIVYLYEEIAQLIGRESEE